MQAPVPRFDVTPATGLRRQINRSDYSLPSAMSPMDVPVPQPAVQTVTGSAIPPQANPYGSQASLPLPSPSLPIQPEVQVVPQPSMKHPATFHYPTQPIKPSSQSYTGYAHSTPAPQVRTAPAPVHYPQDPAAPIPAPATSVWDPNTTMPSHSAPLQAPTSVQLQTPAVNPHAIMYPGTFSHTMPLPQPLNPLMHSYLSDPPPKTPAITTANPGISQMTYGGFMQTHQVKNAQVFTGNADSKILVDDWTRDMQYLLLCATLEW